MVGGLCCILLRHWLGLGLVGWVGWLVGWLVGYACMHAINCIYREHIGHILLLIRIL